jgi:hypothetical protein
MNWDTWLYAGTNYITIYLAFSHCSYSPAMGTRGKRFGIHLIAILLNAKCFALFWSWMTKSLISTPPAITQEPTGGHPVDLKSDRQPFQTQKKQRYPCSANGSPKHCRRENNDHSRSSLQPT